MLPLHGKIQCALWQGKGRATTITSAPNVLECFGSLGRGRSVCMAINVREAIVNFSWRCMRQRVSCLAYVALYAHLQYFPCIQLISRMFKTIRQLQGSYLGRLMSQNICSLCSKRCRIKSIYACLCYTLRYS
jgi:hypothetical protein